MPLRHPNKPARRRRHPNKKRVNRRRHAKRFSRKSAVTHILHESNRRVKRSRVVGGCGVGIESIFWNLTELFTST